MPDGICFQFPESHRNAKHQRPDRVEVSDKITNNTVATIGLIVRNEMALDGIENAAVRMTGSSDYFWYLDDHQWDTRDAAVRSIGYAPTKGVSKSFVRY